MDDPMNRLKLARFTEQQENSRLTDLYALHVMDSIPEERFDRITTLVAHVFGVPFCFITFIDAHRQWIKSTHGGVAGETPLSDSFCRYDLDQQLLLVPDTLLSPEFAETIAVTGPMAVRFYAGAALYSKSGRPLGRLCILGQSARQLTQAEQWTLKRFAELVNQELYFDERLGEIRQDLASAALLDPVTGLPGKLVSEEQLSQMLEKNREDDRFLAVATVHFRRYDELQGTYGSQWVDKVAVLMTERLHYLAGESGYVGRPGADRMLVVGAGFNSEADARNWCQRVYSSLIVPFDVPDTKRTATVAVGASIAPLVGLSADELLNHASLAGNACHNHGLSFYCGDQSVFVQQRD